MARGRPLLPAVRLGATLASRGALFWVSSGLALLFVLFFGAEAIAFSRAGMADGLLLLPGACSSALVWGVGILIAFSASSRALRRDREEGIVALATARGVGRRYLAGRLAGLAVVISAVCAGGTALVGLACVLASRRLHVAGAELAATAGAVLYSVVASVTLATVAFAALGARSRPGGYLRLVFVLLVPDLVARFLDGVVADSWRELFSIPEALAALRGALLPGSLDPGRFLRALVVVLLVLGVALLFARRELSLAGDTREGEAS